MNYRRLEQKLRTLEAAMCAPYDVLHLVERVVPTFCWVCIAGGPFDAYGHCERCGAHTPSYPVVGMMTCPVCHVTHHTRDRAHPDVGMRWGHVLGVCPACAWGSTPEIAERDKAYMTDEEWAHRWEKELADPYAPWNRVAH